MKTARKILPMPDATDSDSRLARMEALLQAVLEKTGKTDAATGAAITIADVAGMFLKDREIAVKVSGGCPKLLERYQRRLASFSERLGTNLVSTCVQRDLVEWIGEHPEWKSSHTKTDAAATIVTCFAWAVSQGIIKASPFRRPKGAWPALQPRVAIKPEEYRKIMAEARRRGRRRAKYAFRVALKFLWETGARTCEMRALSWEHVDWDTGIASLTENKTAKATGDARLIVLTPVLMRLLIKTHRRRKYPNTGTVFLNSQKRPWEACSFAQYFRKIAKRCGVRLTISPYSLRHGFTVQGLENGVGDRQLADLLGHTTTRYVAWYGKSTRKRGDYLRGMLNQVHGKKRDKK